MDSTSSSSRHHDRRRRDSRSRSPGRSSRHRDDRDDRKSGSSRRHRSRSPEERERKSRKHRDKGDESEEERGPPAGVKEIDADDYFLKSNELKVWLDEEKGKRLDQLKSEDARAYFRKFCKAWKRGKLAPKYYAGISSASLSSSLSSAYSWSFSKATQRELDDASSIRKSIDTGTRPLPSSAVGPSLPAAARGPALGPSMPPSALSALQQTRDATASLLNSTRDAERAAMKKGRREDREEERDNRATGRDRQLEKRREVGANMREMREARESGGMVEVSDDVLMGSGGTSDFKAMIAARDHRAQHGRRAQHQEERQAVMSDKMKQYRSKEDETMAQFRALAEARFGAGAPK